MRAVSKPKSLNGGSNCVSLLGRRWDFDTLRNSWQVQEFVRVAKTLAGVMGLKRVRNDPLLFPSGKRKDFVLCEVDCLRPRTLNLWKGCKSHVTEVLLCRDHFARRIPRLNFFVAGAILLKHHL